MTTALHCEVHEGDGPYLLLVHGLLSSRAQWRPNLRALQRVSRPVVVELLGHGRSPAPEDPDAYRPDAYSRAFEQLRERLGAERWLVCGQSLGAALTFRYALSHPDRVIAHVFTNSNSALATHAWNEQVRGAMEVLAADLVARGREAIESLPIHPKRARKLPPDVKRELVADCALHSVHGIGNTGRYTVVGSSCRVRAGSNEVPTLLVQGARERRFAEHARFAAETIPNLRVVALDGGHAINLEAAEAFDGIATAFLSSPDSAGP